MSRAWPLILLVLLMPGTASSDSANLEGGVLIAHHPPGLQYSTGTDYCQRYWQEFAIDSCAEQHNRIDLDGSQGQSSVWYVLAAWSEEKQWCGAEFGFADYDSTIYLFDQRGPCFPDQGMEIPMAGWPGPNKGVAVTTQDTPWSGSFVPIYWVSGYAYDEGEIPLAANPTSEFGGSANCETPPESWAATAFGGMGLFQDGTSACPEGLDGGGGLDGGMQPDGAWGYEDFEPDSPEGFQSTFVEVSTASDSAFIATSRALEQEYGLRSVLTVLPDGIICRATEHQRNALDADPRVSLVTASSIPGIPSITAGDLQPGDAGFPARVWNYILIPCEQDTSGASEELPSCLWYADLEEGRGPPPFDPLNQTSVYMMGDVGVSILFIDSMDDRPCDPGQGVYTENWEDTERNIAYAKILSGLNHLEGLAPSSARFRFTILESPLVYVEDEPIMGDSGFENAWHDDAMDAMGFTEGATPKVQQQAMANARRADPDHLCDWWIIIFAIHDGCGDRRRFADGHISTACFYGPSVNLLYRNGAVYQDPELWLDHIAAHEVCHLFGAPDEYEEGASHCNYLWGYLGVRNGNAEDCPEPQVPCLMDDQYPWQLCDFTPSHLGWRDSDHEDGVLDPIDHPESQRSMRLGLEEALAPGDWVDIYWKDSQEQYFWIKRLACTGWESDQGQMQWDGVGYDGQADLHSDHAWTRNSTGERRAATLIDDTAAPTISDAVITDLGPGSAGHDFELSFRFEDEETQGARVRATARPAEPGPHERQVIPDEFLLDTHGSASPITRAFTLPYPDEGSWLMSIQAWNTGGGYSASEEIPFYWASALGERQVHASELTLSRGHPNPSLGWVTWDLQRPPAGNVDLKIVGVDGRSVRAWNERAVPAGPTKALWDGLDDRGTRVATGTYYLIVTDGSGNMTSRSATLVR